MFTRDDLLTHATIYWTGNAVASSIRACAGNNRCPRAPSHGRTPVIEAPTGITLAGYENPPGVNSPHERIESFPASDRAACYSHVNIAARPAAATSSLGDPGTVDRRPGPDLQADAVTRGSLRTQASRKARRPTHRHA